MLGDLEFRGCARPITEEYNLAANYNQDDVLQAEYYRTFTSSQFLGGNILRLLRSQKKTSSAEITHYTFFRKRVGYTKKKKVDLKHLGNKSMDFEATIADFII